MNYMKKSGGKKKTYMNPIYVKKSYVGMLPKVKPFYGLLNKK